jgi:hypothetical protein
MQMEELKEARLQELTGISNLVRIKTINETHEKL